ncbi:MAG: hypothetical protein KDC19_15415, partial [Saprospiraceae bacterium]|nr:hypothetical protein [Saprospiraceae bacterium]
PLNFDWRCLYCPLETFCRYCWLSPNWKPGAVLPRTMANRVSSWLAVNPLPFIYSLLPPSIQHLDILDG